jgi:hypothetical protein
MTPHTYYYLSDYCDEVCAHVPSLDGIREWLSGPDPACGRDEAAPLGAVYDLNTLTLLGWCKATWTGEGWTLDRQFPSMDFLAAVESDGDTHWSADDILYGENLDDMLAHLGAEGHDADGFDPVWIVSGESNKQPLTLTYNGAGMAPRVGVKVVQ